MIAEIKSYFCHDFSELILDPQLIILSQMIVDYEALISEAIPEQEFKLERKEIEIMTYFEAAEALAK